MSKSVAKFAKILDKVVKDCGGNDGGKGLDVFFEKFIFYLRLPLAWKEKSPYVDK
jgi:hypothetical protein